MPESTKEFEEYEGDDRNIVVKFEQNEDEQEDKFDFFQFDSDLLPEPEQKLNMLEKEKLEDTFEKQDHDTLGSCHSQTEFRLEDKSLQSPSSVGRPKGGAWSEFSSIEENKTTVQCKHCGEEVSARIARINVHLEKCAAVDINIKLRVREGENKPKENVKKKKLKKKNVISKFIQEKYWTNNIERITH